MPAMLQFMLFPAWPMMAERLRGGMCGGRSTAKEQHGRPCVKELRTGKPWATRSSLGVSHRLWMWLHIWPAFLMTVLSVVVVERTAKPKGFWFKLYTHPGHRRMYSCSHSRTTGERHS